MKGKSKSEEVDESDRVIRDSILMEKNKDTEAIAKNKEKLVTVRFYLAILAGIISGILSLTGLIGIAFYFANFFISSFLVVGYVKRIKGNFFTSDLELVFTGLFDHGMVYTIFWVMFYNLVHIYS